jgi:hypothetical protein
MCMHRFVARLTANILQKSDSARHLKSQVEEAILKEKEQKELLAQSTPLMQTLRDEVKQLQRFVERELSEFSGRPVHLIGEINSI